MCNRKEDLRCWSGFLCVLKRLSAEGAGTFFMDTNLPSASALLESGNGCGRWLNDMLIMRLCHLPSSLRAGGLAQRLRKPSTICKQGLLRYMRNFLALKETLRVRQVIEKQVGTEGVQHGQWSIMTRKQASREFNGVTEQIWRGSVGSGNWRPFAYKQRKRSVGTKNGDDDLEHETRKMQQVCGDVRRHTPAVSAVGTFLNA